MTDVPAHGRRATVGRRRVARDVRHTGCRDAPVRETGRRDIRNRPRHRNHSAMLPRPRHRVSGVGSHCAEFRPVRNSDLCEARLLRHVSRETLSCRRRVFMVGLAGFVSGGGIPASSCRAPECGEQFRRRVDPFCRPEGSSWSLTTVPMASILARRRSGLPIFRSMNQSGSVDRLDLRGASEPGSRTRRMTGARIVGRVGTWVKTHSRSTTRRLVIAVPGSPANPVPATPANRDSARYSGNRGTEVTKICLCSLISNSRHTSNTDP
jgi:hypothetical protein